MSNENKVQLQSASNNKRLPLYLLVVVLLLFFSLQNLNISNCDDCTAIDAIRIGKEQQEQQRRRLEFVHIPKTGGTAIESIAKDANLTWSICHFGSPETISKISNGLVHCHSRTGNHKHPGWPSGLSWQSKLFFNCPWWHVPPAHIKAFFPKENPYAGANLFAVVRNPYERIISEYYYDIRELRNPHQEKKGKRNVNDEVTNFNNVLHSWLSEFSSEMQKGDLSRRIPANNIYFSHDGHLIPQYDFVYQTDMGKPTKSVKVVQHVLRFERLRTDFSDLMQAYDLPIQLPTTRVRPKTETKLSVENLTIENMLLIENLYQDDFREFGYEVLSKKLLEKERRHHHRLAE